MLVGVIETHGTCCDFGTSRGLFAVPVSTVATNSHPAIALLPRLPDNLRPQIGYDLRYQRDIPILIPFQDSIS